MPVFCGQGITDALLVPTSVSTILFLPVYNVSGNAEWFFIYGKRCIVTSCTKCRCDGLGNLYWTGIPGIRAMIVNSIGWLFPAMPAAAVMVGQYPIPISAFP